MARKNLIITSATTGGIPLGVHFDEPPVVAACPVTQFAGYKGGPPGRAGYNQWLHEFGSGGLVVPGIFERHGGKGHELGRVCVMGFSNGCILVDELMKFADAPQIDVVLAVDGIQNLAVSAEVDYGRYVVGFHADQVDAPAMAITHSAIVPPNSPSTTETANEIWKQVSAVAPANALTEMCGFDCQPAIVIGDMRSIKADFSVSSPTAKRVFVWHGLEDGWHDRRNSNNVYVFGWGDKNPQTGKIQTRDPFGTADHIFQGKYVLAALVRGLVARRWNTTVSAVSGFGSFGAVTTKPAQGIVYGHGYPSRFVRTAREDTSNAAARARALIEAFFAPAGLQLPGSGDLAKLAWGLGGLAGGVVLAKTVSKLFE